MPGFWVCRHLDRLRGLAARVATAEVRGHRAPVAPKRALGIGLLCGAAAAVFNAWLLLRWLGLGFWFLMLVVPASVIAIQAVGGGVARILLGTEPGL